MRLLADQPQRHGHGRVGDASTSVDKRAIVCCGSTNTGFLGGESPRKRPLSSAAA